MTTQTTRILVVDDEQTQLETVCRGLFLYGYDCTGAKSAREALRLLEQAPMAYSLVLTDLTMPERTGLDLIEKLFRRWPALPVIVITGLAQTPELEQVKEMGIPFLQKPFDPDQLVARIRETLLR